MPGAVPNTSTNALTNATLPYSVELADRGRAEARRRDHARASGRNTHDGKVEYREGAEAHGQEDVDLATRRAEDSKRQRRYTNSCRQPAHPTGPCKGPAGCV
ncbi:hypothetical protein STENM36S_05873 [Streptomyces tendae]